MSETEITHIHDTFFRETMSHKEVAADFLANYLPAKVLDHIRLDTLTITKDSFVSEKLAEYYSDLLYHVKCTGNRLGLIYFLFEHKSYPDIFTDLQLLSYLSENWQLIRKQFPNAKKLPLIIPIIVYHGKPKGKAIRLVDLIDLPHPDLACYVPTFDTAFYDFSPAADEAIKGDLLFKTVPALPQSQEHSRIPRNIHPDSASPGPHARRHHRHALDAKNFPLPLPGHGHRAWRRA